MTKELDSLQLSLKKLIDDPLLRDASIGYMIIDCTGKTPQILAENSPSKTMIPASTLKLFVTGAALEIIGAAVVPEVYTINQLSINWRASKLLRRIGGEKYGRTTNDNGYRAILDFWARKGLDLSGIHFDDGNGLSRNNAISPKMLVDLLTVMQYSPWYGTFYSSLPVAGISGTMKKALKGTPAVGHVRAKTGTIAGVKSLAGYVSCFSGRKLVFAIIINNYTCKKKVLKQRLEEVMLRMTEV
jgi:D-alanyl-D-alanine carboxypeptidase/D-alanyl-D-alanine-endopeptidase (penicillin-binding protein 4)